MRTSRASVILRTSNPQPTTLPPTWTRSPGRRSQRRAEGVPGRRLTRKSNDLSRAVEAGGGEEMARKMG